MASVQKLGPAQVVGPALIYDYNRDLTLDDLCRMYRS